MNSGHETCSVDSKAPKRFTDELSFSYWQQNPVGKM